MRDWWVAESRLERCRFAAVKGTFLFGAGKRTSEYVECSFDGAQLSGHNTGLARFVRCSFHDVRVSKMLFPHAEFIDCVFTGKLREINFDARVSARHQDRVGRSSNRYERNDFSGATLTWVAFRYGVDLLDQRLPSEPGYLLVADAERILPAALAEVLTWPDSPEKKEILRRLNTALLTMNDGQRQLLFSPHDWVGPDGTRERAFAQLSELMSSLGARNPGAAT